jgi:hypothetical protein
MGVSALEGLEFSDEGTVVIVLILRALATIGRAWSLYRAVGLVGVLEIARLGQPGTGAARVGALVYLYLEDVKLRKGDETGNETNIEDVDEDSVVAFLVEGTFAVAAGG